MFSHNLDSSMHDCGRKKEDDATGEVSKQDVVIVNSREEDKGAVMQSIRSGKDKKSSRMDASISQSPEGASVPLKIELEKEEVSTSGK